MKKVLQLAVLSLALFSCRKDEMSPGVDYSDLLGKWFLERVEVDSSNIKHYNGNFYNDPEYCTCTFLEEESKFSSDAYKLQGILYNCNSSIDYHGWVLYEDYIRVTGAPGGGVSDYYINYFTADSLSLTRNGSNFMYSRADNFTTCGYTYAFDLSETPPDSALIVTYRDADGYLASEYVNSNSWSKTVWPNHVDSIQEKFHYDFTLKPNPNFQSTIAANTIINAQVSLLDEQGVSRSINSKPICIQGTDMIACDEDSLFISMLCLTF
ncbi:hypothetical protein K6119_09475 [Paracrocinitomix mangrovi]|uniref:hypothetical protein n=1 Tax=Paracrocinitomix mangrovi TaxID=2862509 RepID=UPI001C8D2642|nr:hypothetical protein [Paracrocinitomix mangrovi]UKN03720.1 hypothetical protein K6119_09475 [Paracrocinitomix mangrovi]